MVLVEALNYLNSFNPSLASRLWNEVGKGKIAQVLQDTRIVSYIEESSIPDFLKKNGNTCSTVGVDSNVSG